MHFFYTSAETHNTVRLPSTCTHRFKLRKTCLTFIEKYKSATYVELLGRKDHQMTEKCGQVFALEQQLARADTDRPVKGWVKEGLSDRLREGRRMPGC